MDHPALKNFNTPWEAIKHVGGKALKWAAYGAIAVAALSFIVPITPIVTALGGVASWFNAGSATGAMMSVLVPALKIGATAGAVMGAVSGVGGLSKALDEKRLDTVADYDQAVVAKERAQLMAMQRGQGAGSGVSPGISGYGRGQQPGVGVGM